MNDSWNWDGVVDHLELYKAMSDYFLSKPGGIKVTEPELFKVEQSLKIEWLEMESIFFYSTCSYFIV